MSALIMPVAISPQYDGGMGPLYGRSMNLCSFLSSGAAPHINNVELGKHGRYRTNVWSYACLTALAATGMI